MPHQKIEQKLLSAQENIKLLSVVLKVYVQYEFNLACKHNLNNIQKWNKSSVNIRRNVEF